MDKICFFAGHGKLNYGDDIYNKLKNCVESLICEEKIYEFRVGNYGAFDNMAARAVRSLKKRYPQIKLCLVIPYVTSKINHNKNEYQNAYDEIIVPPVASDAPKRAYIPLCNKYMADKASVLVCYVKYSVGGAAKTLNYTQNKKNIKVINLAP